MFAHLVLNFKMQFIIFMYKDMYWGSCYRVDYDLSQPKKASQQTQQACIGSLIQSRFYWVASSPIML